MKSFRNKVAAITGAGSGIGRALALQLAGQGCALALSDVNAEGLAETVSAARAKGVAVTDAVVDVAQRQQVYDWADASVQAHGGVNLVFNNAGVALGAPISGMSEEDLKWIMDINFWGVVYGTQAFLPHLKASGDGHVINISSVFGIAAIPSQSAYNASKFAVRGFTEALRQELEIEGAPVSATTVHPGGIKTNIARSARFSGQMKDFLGVDEAAGKTSFERLFITTADKAASVILAAVKGNRRRVLIGPDARAIDLMVRLMPERYQQVVSFASKQQKRLAR
ncbi:SDR family NAD(P)-dependent oxidoreductase [Flagellatimonas centrodinii]|uniref:SDR family NAD(P)-dependent oxidoreductase n=1 Tax=Flagellatimonas centrodinii TaxID=2806210 RepID=UPI001FEFC5AE|nr:SDR family NAD(P)-dependent oxidoreductase [Flagellatimonas centrodinii]ULQ48196.1 SDR family NAD(P)-dependent oxidoreductase [Flagellatimonas centrodinii]